MDKENLYYVVAKETNSRVKTVLFDPWIGSKEAAEEHVRLVESISKSKYEIISIQKYEDTYEEPIDVTPFDRPFPKYKGSIAP